jgi:hypothetical protein
MAELSSCNIDCLAPKPQDLLSDPVQKKFTVPWYQLADLYYLYHYFLSAKQKVKWSLYLDAVME